MKVSTEPGQLQTYPWQLTIERFEPIIRNAQRLAGAGAVASVGSTDDTYDNALAQALNSLFMAELVRSKGP